MKKIICFLISLCCICLASCSGGYIVRNKKSEKAPSITSLPDIYVDMENGDIRKKADTALFEEYKISDYENYNITVDTSGSQIKITYEFRFHGYNTDERFDVYIENETGEISSVFGRAKGYANYLNKVSEDSLKEAEEKLKKIGEGKYGDHIYAVCWDDEDYLCLRLIVESKGPLLNGIPMDITNEVFYERLYS